MSAEIAHRVTPDLPPVLAGTLTPEVRGQGRGLLPIRRRHL